MGLGIVGTFVLIIFRYFSAVPNVNRSISISVYKLLVHNLSLNHNFPVKKC